MDGLGSGIPLDPTTDTGSAGATESVLSGEGRGGQDGGGNHPPSPRREAGRRGALGSGVGEGGSHVGRARGASSVAPPPPGGAGRGG